MSDSRVACALKLELFDVAADALRRFIIGIRALLIRRLGPPPGEGRLATLDWRSRQKKIEC